MPLPKSKAIKLSTIASSTIRHLIVHGLCALEDLSFFSGQGWQSVQLLNYQEEITKLETLFLERFKLALSWRCIQIENETQIHSSAELIEFMIVYSVDAIMRQLLNQILLGPNKQQFLPLLPIIKSSNGHRPRILEYSPAAIKRLQGMWVESAELNLLSLKSKERATLNKLSETLFKGLAHAIQHAPISAAIDFACTHRFNHHFQIELQEANTYCDGSIQEGDFDTKAHYLIDWEKEKPLIAEEGVQMKVPLVTSL